MLKIKNYLYIFCFSLLLCACTVTKKEPEAKEYEIYYLNSSGSAIVPIKYTASTPEENEEGLIEELMSELMEVPKDKDLMKVLGDNVTYMGYTRDKNVLYLNFDTNYSSMKPIREILARAALVKTLTQIKGIDFIGINSGDQPLADSGGNPLPIFYASEFIDTVTDINTFEKAELTLYFKAKDENRLVAENRSLVYNVNVSREKLVIDELIKGPKNEGSVGLLPPGLEVNNVSVNDNTCYIDFDEGIMNALNKADNRLLIYSIVNSVCEPGNVTKVQISVNGETNYRLANDIDLSKTFDRNLDYIEEE